MGALTLRNLLEAGDVVGAMAFWAEHSPHLPQLKDVAQGEIALHMARTATKSVRFSKRAYSHAWLTERALPSQLPDELKPRAERLYPRVVSAVMVGGRVRNPYFAPAVEEAHQAMRYAVLDAEADGRLEDDAFVRQRMFEARDRTYKQLFGTAQLAKEA